MAPTAAQKAAKQAKFYAKRTKKRQEEGARMREQEEAQAFGSSRSRSRSRSLETQVLAKAVVSGREAKRLFTLAKSIRNAKAEDIAEPAKKWQQLESEGFWFPTQPASSGSSSSSGSTPNQRLQLLATEERIRKERLAVLVSAIPGGLQQEGTQLESKGGEPRQSPFDTLPVAAPVMGSAWMGNEKQ